MMTHAELDAYLLKFDSATKTADLDNRDIGYTVVDRAGETKLFAVVVENSRPIQISLRCDPLLAKTLRERYESVVPATKLHRRSWNTILWTGQLSDDEIKDLVHLSYRLARGEVVATL